MNKSIVGAVACAVILALGHQAHAAVHSVNCVGVQATDQATFAALSLSGGDTIQLNNGNGSPALCAGDYKFTNNLNFENHLANNTAQSTDGFNGMVEIASGAHITFNGLTFEGTSLSPTTTSNATNSTSTFDEVGAIAVHDASQINVENSQVGPATVAGILATRGAAVSVTNAVISGNGTLGADTLTSNGITATDGSSVRLGAPSGASNTAVTIGGNGPQSGSGCPGFGIALAQSSSLSAFVSTIGGATAGGADTNGNTCGQLILETASSARIEATSILQPDHVDNGATAITALDGSTVFLDPNVNLSAPAADDIVAVGTTSSNTNGAILVASASSLIMNSASINATGTQQPVIEASANSSYVLASNNNVCAGALSGSVCAPTTGATAVEIDHSSSLVQQLGRNFGLNTTGAEAITGKGTVLMQSSMELGQGATSTPAFGMVWNGTIAVGQNSAIRMQGGVHVTGQVQISAASNGYFNCNNAGGLTNAGCTAGGSTGAANEVDGDVLCLELVSSPDNPNVHVSNPQVVVRDTSNDSGVTVANLFGSNSFANPPGGGIAANTCLNF